MPRRPKNFAIDRVVHVTPHQRAAPVRTGTDTAVPSRFACRVALTEPRVVVDLEISVAPGGRPRVIELTVIAPLETDEAVPINSVTLRGILVDQVVRVAMTAATQPIKANRPDLHPRAFQMEGDDPSEAHVSPPRGVDERVHKAARIYTTAAMQGSNAPTEAVALELGVSRSQASRYVRTAREAGLLPAVGVTGQEMVHARYLGMWRLLLQTLEGSREALKTANGADHDVYRGRIEDFEQRLQRHEQQWRAYRASHHRAQLPQLPEELAHLDREDQGAT